MMKNTVGFLDTKGVRDISGELLGHSGELRLFPTCHYHKYSWEEFRLFCHKYARYGIPTAELIEFLNKKIDNRSAIEIGAGAGDLGFHLGIPMTDSKIQQRPDVKFQYKVAGQPTIYYPNDMEKIEALDAVKKYQPQVVIGSWITTYSPVETSYPSSPHGIKEDKILPLVEMLILIGNDDVHGGKPILKQPHEKIYPSWLVSRAKNQSNNVIYIWDNKK